MRKFVSYLPLVLTVFLSVYGAFDSAVYSYIVGHSRLSVALGLLFVASETLAATSYVKSNSVALAIFDFLDSVLSALLHKAPDESTNQ